MADCKKTNMVLRCNGQSGRRYGFKYSKLWQSAYLVVLLGSHGVSYCDKNEEQKNALFGDCIPVAVFAVGIGSSLYVYIPFLCECTVYYACALSRV